MNPRATKIIDIALTRPIGWCTSGTSTAAMVTPNAASVIRVTSGRDDATNATSNGR
jgi:alpha-D-ribose 1-methylphosphonate 5-phosphate C-P lyase